MHSNLHDDVFIENMNLNLYKLLHVKLHKVHKMFCETFSSVCKNIISIKLTKKVYFNKKCQYIIENIIYNELIIRGYIVNVGVVDNFEKQKDKTVRNNLKIDFIAEKNG